MLQVRLLKILVRIFCIRLGDLFSYIFLSYTKHEAEILTYKAQVRSQAYTAEERRGISSDLLDIATLHSSSDRHYNIR